PSPGRDAYPYSGGFCTARSPGPGHAGTHYGGEAHGQDVISASGGIRLQSNIKRLRTTTVEPRSEHAGVSASRIRSSRAVSHRRNRQTRPRRTGGCRPLAEPEKHTWRIISLDRRQGRGRYWRRRWLWRACTGGASIEPASHLPFTL
ncbi:hypothetical protein JZ751_013154, partial [Albula glossodonta]